MKFWNCGRFKQNAAGLLSVLTLGTLSAQAEVLPSATAPLTGKTAHGTKTAQGTKKVTLPAAALQGLQPWQQGVLRQLAKRGVPAATAVHTEAAAHTEAMLPVHACFAPGTSAEKRAKVEALIAQRFTPGLAAFRLSNRWTQTATNSAGGLQQGDTMTLTWSIVPDGLSLPGSIGEPTSNSDLRAFLDGIYGSQATWLPLFQQVFDRWSALTGITYVYEASDDGATFLSSVGQLGARGDVRIGGHFIDGPSNTLAYNFFPNTGDMVIDTGDTFYNITTSNSLRLRNVLAHEHGHGLGLSHTCPIEQSKLMQPLASTAFDGPQFDDILTAQRAYGDVLEKTVAGNNDSVANAADLGTVSNSITQANNLSIDDNADVDYYKFTTASAGAAFSLSLSPGGSAYLEGAQNGDGSCSAGTTFDPTTINDLSVQVLASNGSTVLATANAAGAGGIEQISSLVLSGTGPFYLRVSGGNVDNIQAYSLAMTLSATQLGPVFTVTSTADAGDGTCDVAGTGDGCTLREAITIANGTGGSNTIVFAAGVSGTINLAGALPALSEAITITGPGANTLTVRRDTGGSYAVLTINSGVTATISGLTFTNGSSSSAGGGLVNNGTLALTSCAVTGNSGGGLGGGGIYNRNSLTATNCQVSGNISSTYGGGILNDGTLTLVNCTIANNQCTQGGAVADNNGNETFNVSHCTIAGNTSTLNGSGGAFDVYSSSTVNIAHTILSNNTANGVLSNHATTAGTLPALVSGDYNLSDDAPLGLSGAHDLINTNPLLDSAGLKNNGGPTQSIALQINSPAIDAGNPAISGAPATDQRGSGFARVAGENIDIGAVEFEFFLTATIAPGSNATFSEGAGSNAAIMRVTRGGSTTSALGLTLRTSDITEAIIVGSATIAAGQSFVDVPVTAVDDTFVDGTQSLLVKAAASGYRSIKGSLNVTDNDLTALRVTLAPSAFFENKSGTATTLKVEHNRQDLSTAVVVNLASTDARLQVPAQATIPAGKRTVEVPLTVTSSASITGTSTATITASSGGFTSANTTATIYDVQAALTMSIAPGQLGFVSEGPNFTTTQIRLQRNTSTASALVVPLKFRRGAGQVSIPLTVTIPVGQSFVDFTVTAIDDGLIESTQSIALQTQLLGYQNASVGFYILDNDSSSDLLTPTPQPSR